MLKNIIFDLGNTVLRFVPEEIAHCFYKEEKGFDTLIRTVFDRKYWSRLDDGSISQDDFKRGVQSELPEYLHPYSDKICDEWQFVLPVIEGMEELIDDLHRDGYNLYVISNISENFSRCREQIPILKKFDGLILSADEKTAKPGIKIYELALSRFGIKPEESLFIDDLEPNIRGGELAGIKGYLFDGDVQRLRSYIYKNREN